jgi:hypothetical protein
MTSKYTHTSSHVFPEKSPIDTLLPQELRLYKYSLTPPPLPYAPYTPQTPTNS